MTKLGQECTFCHDDINADSQAEDNTSVDVTADNQSMRERGHIFNLFKSPRFYLKLLYGKTGSTSEETGVGWCRSLNSRGGRAENLIQTCIMDLAKNKYIQSFFYTLSTKHKFCYFYTMGFCVYFEVHHQACIRKYHDTIYVLLWCHNHMQEMFLTL